VGVIVPPTETITKNSAFATAGAGNGWPTTKDFSAPSAVTEIIAPVEPSMVPAKVRLLVTDKALIWS
jgi:hypothetical protein